jgi:DNA transformation protein and related proteins
MSAGGSDYVDFVKDQLASLQGVSIGRFFGGIGLSCEGTQFAMIMGSSLYFVVDDSTRPKYERMGSDCFSYSTKKGRVDVRKYYAVPVEVIEEEERLVALARESIRIAAVSKKSPTSRSTRSRTKTRAPG